MDGARDSSSSLRLREDFTRGTAAPATPSVAGRTARRGGRWRRRPNSKSRRERRKRNRSVDDDDDDDDDGDEDVVVDAD